MPLFARNHLVNDLLVFVHNLRCSEGNYSSIHSGFEYLTRLSAKERSGDNDVGVYDDPHARFLERTAAMASSMSDSL